MKGLVRLGQLVGKVAIVTGSTSGIGRGVAVRLARAGARIVVTGRRGDLGAEVIREIESRGGTAAFARADLENAADAGGLVTTAVELFGGVDILVNCAMTTDVPWQVSKGVTDTDESEWRKLLDVGIIGPAMICRAAIPVMAGRGGGCVVTIGSVRSQFPASGGIGYDVVKAGLVNFSRQLNLDYGDLGIRSNLICPGWIVTEDAEAAIVDSDPAYQPRIKIMQTVGRAGRPADIAEAALFLCSERSGFIAGAVLTVDGGLTIGTHIDVEDRLRAHYAAGGCRAVG
jgi:NAD(P)-dependent dehydrogenase (short-subunit alcohol dehydrogenase family)